MSGSKTRTIDTREYDRLQRAARTATNEQQRRQESEARERASRQRADQLASQLSVERQRHERIEHAVARLGREMEAAARETHRAIANVQAQSRESLQAFAQATRSELGRVERHVNEQVARVRQEGEQREARLKSHVDDRERAIRETVRRVAQEAHDHTARVEARLDERERTEADRWAWWAEALDVELDVIEREYRHDLFAPGALAALRQRAALATRNAGEGVLQAAVAGGQEAWMQATELRARLELEQSRWETERALALEELDVAQAELDARGTVELRLPEQAPYEVDVDHWSEGGLSALREELDAVRARVADDAAPPRIDELVALRSGLATSAERLAGVVGEARDAVLASVVRRDELAELHERLTGRGWTLSGSVWDEDDERRPIRAVYANAAGERIALGVVPGTPGAGPTLEIDFDDHSRSDAERAERLRLLAPGAAAGLSTRAGFETGNGRPEAFDLEKRRAPAKAASQPAKG